MKARPLLLVILSTSYFRKESKWRFRSLRLDDLPLPTKRGRTTQTGQGFDVFLKTYVYKNKQLLSYSASIYDDYAMYTSGCYASPW